MAGLAPAPKTVFVTHGEPRSAQALATRVRRNLGAEAIVPAYGDEVVLADQEDVSSGQVRVALASGQMPRAGATVTSDLRVREADAHHVVLEGTITIDLD